MEQSVTTSEVVSIIVCIILAFLMYIVGIYLNIKIIKVSQKDKEITWKLDITHSALVIAVVSHSFFMNGITYFMDNLYEYTGEWFCYVSKVLEHYGHLYVAGHSLIIVIMKFVLIVHWDWARMKGNDRIKEVFFWINLLHPVVTILCNLIVRPDFFWAYDGMKNFDICLGDPKKLWVPERNTSFTKLHNLCELTEPSPENYFEYTVFLLRFSLCWVNVAVFYLVMFNIFEMLIYFIIFRWGIR